MSKNVPLLEIDGNSDDKKDKDYMDDKSSTDSDDYRYDNETDSDHDVGISDINPSHHPVTVVVVEDANNGDGDDS